MKRVWENCHKYTVLEQYDEHLTRPPPEEGQSITSKEKLGRKLTMRHSQTLLEWIMNILYKPGRDIEVLLGTRPGTLMAAITCLPWPVL